MGVSIIEIAKLAGLPNEVIKRAKEVLATIEKTSVNLRTSEREEARLEIEEETTISFEECLRDQAIEELMW